MTHISDLVVEYGCVFSNNQLPYIVINLGRRSSNSCHCTSFSITLFQFASLSSFSISVSVNLAVLDIVVDSLKRIIAVTIIAVSWGENIERWD